MVEVRNLPVEPQMDACDGRIFEVGDFLAELSTLAAAVGQNAIESVEGKGEDEKVKVPTSANSGPKWGARGIRNRVWVLILLVAQLNLNLR